jgi:hypothetical protein
MNESSVCAILYIRCGRGYLAAVSCHWLFAESGEEAKTQLGGPWALQSRAVLSRHRVPRTHTYRNKRCWCGVKNVDVP